MRKEIIGALLSGAAIIALSGCSSGVKETPELNEVNVADLPEGRAVTFMEVLNGLGDAGSNEVEILGDPEPSEYVYKFCPTGQEADNAQIQSDPDYSGNYKRYVIGSSIPDQNGTFEIDADGDIHIHWSGQNRIIDTNNTHKLEVGKVYEFDCGDPDLEVEKIEIITCQEADD